MANENAERRAVGLLMRPADDKPVGAAIEARKLEALGPKPEIAAEVRFSVFIPAHQQLAVDLAAELMDIANTQGLDAALARAEEAAEETSVELVQYALMIFITHHPEGQTLTIPPLEERAPELVKPRVAAVRTDSELESLGASGDEAALDWYREDASANAHHERWHVVYPFGGIPDPNDPAMRTTKDRQGELFLYMHEQMLARYDTERLAAGLTAPTTSLADYREALPEGYFPMLRNFDNRQPDSLMTDSTGFDVNELESWAGALFADVPKKNAKLQRPDGTKVDATPDLIGDTVEANAASVNERRYGALHNMGHVTIAYIPDPQSTRQQAGGVMRATTVAIRDPIFYRWHRHIDDLHFLWQEKQDEQRFDDAPKAIVHDIALVLAEKVIGDAQAFGDTNFGGDRWMKAPADSGLTTDDLTTTMRQRTVGNTTRQELDHDDFYYFFRIESEGAEPQPVTVRIFLVADPWTEDRRRWIELDRFQQTLQPGRNVVPRSSSLSAVVRKPAARPGHPQPPREPGADPNYCDCGWPYHLLLPRGTREGMRFRLMVMLTDWNLDKVEVEGKCGSMSFCGKKDVAYPDKRPMGYPFDRRWAKPIAETIVNQQNMSARDVTIRWV